MPEHDPHDHLHDHDKGLSHDLPRIVERSTMLTRSNAPAAASASIESHISRESPKTTIEAPKPATTVNRIHQMIDT